MNGARWAQRPEGSNWGEFGPDRISLIASSSKQLTAGVMLALQDQGLLDLDAPLPDIVGDAWGPGVADITSSTEWTSVMSSRRASPTSRYSELL